MVIITTSTCNQLCYFANQLHWDFGSTTLKSLFNKLVVRHGLCYSLIAPLRVNTVGFSSEDINSIPNYGVFLKYGLDYFKTLAYP